MPLNKKTDIDWKPRRVGRIYCSSACGGRCTYAAYNLARTEAAALARTLGAGWSARVYENLGWHFTVENPRKRLSVSYSGDSYEHGYMASLAGRYTGYGKQPHLAIADAINKARPHLAEMKALIACIEGLPWLP